MTLRVMAIGRRDLAAYFLSPSGYIITALFIFVTGIFFIRGFEQGQTASMRPVFDIGIWVLLFVGPAITMRAISDEVRMGTYEMLMTSPLSEFELILGKFIAAVIFMAIMLVPTIGYVIALELHGRPDYGELICGYLGLSLAGTAYLASGILASAVAGSQVVAFLAALFFWLLLSIGTKLLPPYAGEQWAGLVVALDPDLRLRDFAIGLIDTANVAYFLALTAVFLLAAVKVLEVRRWR